MLFHSTDCDGDGCDDELMFTQPARQSEPVCQGGEDDGLDGDNEDDSGDDDDGVVSGGRFFFIQSSWCTVKS